MMRPLTPSAGAGPPFQTWTIVAGPRPSFFHIGYPRFEHGSPVGHPDSTVHGPRGRRAHFLADVVAVVTPRRNRPPPLGGKPWTYATYDMRCGPCWLSRWAS